MIPKLQAGKILRNFVVLKYKKPIGRRNNRVVYKWETAYIPRMEIEALIRKIIFKKRFFEEMIEIVKKEMLK